MFLAKLREPTIQRNLFFANFVDSIFVHTNGAVAVSLVDMLELLWVLSSSVWVDISSICVCALWV